MKLTTFGIQLNSFGNIFNTFVITIVLQKLNKTRLIILRIFKTQQIIL